MASWSWNCNNPPAIKPGLSKDLAMYIQVIRWCSLFYWSTGSPTDWSFFKYEFFSRYNDKTYRVDDINFNINATNTFKRNVKGVEQEISYIQYYQEVHNIQVSEKMQPLLVSRPKKKDQRPGAPEVLYLLPELCTMTGITDEVRANFNVMKDLAVHTRIDPTRRVATCNDFMNLIMSNPQARARLDGWGLQFESTLLKLTGRKLNLEDILMGDRGNQTRKVGPCVHPFQIGCLNVKFIIG